MSQVVVPDIGDFKEVEVIEVLVKPGVAVTKEQSLITLESDKATMEIPSPNAGVVKELKVKVGDKISKGSPILVLDDKSNGEAPPEPKAPPARAEAPKAAAGGAMTVPVPDIGDFKEIEVIEVLVKPGDAVSKEQSLITLESDKATMEIPSPAAGKVTQLKLKVGDKVSKGSLILLLEGEAAKAEAPAPAPKAPEASKPSAPTPSTGADVDCDVVVIGAGPGGYSAAFRAADLGMKTVLVERYATLGGVCLNVGCIPSKALLHTAAVMDAARGLADHGVSFGEPKLDLAKLRAFKEKVVGKLTGGLAAMAKMRKVTVMTGVAKFSDKNTLDVAGKKLRFANAIIAVGSQAAKLPFLPQDPRIVDSTGALELKGVPKRMLIIGGGIIGLEMGTVYSTLGTRLDVVEMMDGLMLGADRDLVAVWQKMNARRFDNVMLGTKTTKVEAAKDGLKVTFEGKPAQTYDAILVSVGRVPNGKNIAADKAGVNV